MKSIHFVFAGLIVLSLVLCGCSRQGENASSENQMVKDLAAAWRAHDLDKLISFYTDDCVYEDVVFDKVIHGKEELRAYFKDALDGFPDFKFDLKPVVASKDHLCMEWIMSGTQTGNRPNLPATGKSFSVRGVSVCGLKDGKIQHNSDYYDGATFLRQLGVQPQTAATDPFVGTWKLNLAKSKLLGPPPLPKSVTFNVVPKGDGFNWTTDFIMGDGQALHMEWSGKYDGKDYPETGDPDADTNALKKIDANSLVEVDKKAGKEVGNFRSVISKDGKTLTQTGKYKDAKGQEFSGIAVYDKQ